VGRVALERCTIHFPDILTDSEYHWPDAQRIAGFRTVLGVPMLREGARAATRLQVESGTSLHPSPL
jgi:hypothetical protein